MTIISTNEHKFEGLYRGLYKLPESYKWLGLYLEM